MISYHFVFCPKYREPLMANAEVRRTIDVVFKFICEEQHWQIRAFEQMPDHLHLLIETTTTASPAYIAQRLKGASSRELRKNLPFLKGAVKEHFWARRYHVDSIGMQSQETVAHYIERQEIAYQRQYGHKPFEPKRIVQPVRVQIPRAKPQRSLL